MFGWIEVKYEGIFNVGQMKMNLVCMEHEGDKSDYNRWCIKMSLELRYEK